MRRGVDRAVPVKVITSRDNALFKSLKKLGASSRERRKHGQALLDGVHLISDYAERIGQPEMLIVSGAGSDKAEVRALRARLHAVATTEMTDALFQELAPVDTPSGVLALVRVPQIEVPETIRFAVLVEAVQDPGNLGSILRSAAAAGVEVAYLSPGCADAWSPRVLRGGMGAHFSLPVREGVDVVETARRFSGEVVVTSLQAQDSIFALDLTGSIALVIGNEGAGVSQSLREAATRLARIPMPGALESLNAAAAAAVCLFERVRQLEI